MSGAVHGRGAVARPCSRVVNTSGIGSRSGPRSRLEAPGHGGASTRRRPVGLARPRGASIGATGTDDTCGGACCAAPRVGAGVGIAQHSPGARTTARSRWRRPEQGPLRCRGLARQRAGTRCSSAAATAGGGWAAIAARGASHARASSASLCRCWHRRRLAARGQQRGVRVTARSHSHAPTESCAAWRQRLHALAVISHGIRRDGVYSLCAANCRLARAPNCAGTASHGGHRAHGGTRVVAQTQVRGRVVGAVQTKVLAALAPEDPFLVLDP